MNDTTQSIPQAIRRALPSAVPLSAFSMTTIQELVDCEIQVNVVKLRRLNDDDSISIPSDAPVATLPGWFIGDPTSDTCMGAETREAAARAHIKNPLFNALIKEDGWVYTHMSTSRKAWVLMSDGTTLQLMLELEMNVIVNQPPEPECGSLHGHKWIDRHGRNPDSVARTLIETRILARMGSQ